MIVNLFYLLFLIIQIFILVKAIKKKNEKNWCLLFSTITSSILFTIIFFVYTYIYRRNYIGWDMAGYCIFSMIAISIYILMLIIGVIIKVISNKESDMQKLGKNEVEKKIIKKNLIINIIIFFIIFLIALFLDDLPYEIEQENVRISENKAREQVIVLLTQLYGDGDFKIVEMFTDTDNIGLSNYVKGYKFTISTSYLDHNFMVGLAKDNFEIYENDFLNEYYKEKLKEVPLESYLTVYKRAELNKIISQNFNVKINSIDILPADFLDKDYGKVPSINELSDSIEVSSFFIEIKEDITTEDELLNYLVKLTKFCIENFDIYSFSYKYDFTKLGIDNYDGHGYVSRKLDPYDTTININIMSHITKFKLEEILKEG